LLMVADSMMLALAVWLSFNMLGINAGDKIEQLFVFTSLAIIVSVLGFFKIGLYRALLLYMGVQSGFIVLQGVTFAAGLFGAVYYLVLSPENPDNAVIPIFWMIALLFIGGSRFVAKLALQSLIENF